MQLLRDFYRNRKVLVTGHTGFKGSWLTLWLHDMGAKVSGLALEPRTADDLFVVARIGSVLEADYREDIRDTDGVIRVLCKEQPEIVFHLAAQPLVSEGYADPVGTCATNVMGSVNILESARHCPSLKAVVMVTSDKCYENREQSEGYKESDPMGGYDPYSASKGAAELLISAYRRSFFSKTTDAAVASVRAGNVIGGGDRADNRIIPDCVRAFASGRPVELRNPGSTRPWQHVLEPLGGYLLLAMKMFGNRDYYSTAWNFGPREKENRRVIDLVEAFIAGYGSGSVRITNAGLPHEAVLLSLDITRAREMLGWKPLLDFRETVTMTADWYRRSLNEDPLSLCLQQIKNYSERWNSLKEG
ncbi:MAG: CDP-glucose 4,6-dehydratase [Bacteroidales bacterium]|nr:CDP-glucose 4,6-dehydratase [Bacteroidales bacterium]